MLKRRPGKIALLFLFGFVVCCSAAGRPRPAEVVVPLADRLAEEQVPEGPLGGSWPGEEAYTGTIVAGLVGAYELTCDERYRQAAEAGGVFFTNAAEGNLYGDEAYALVRLSEMSGPSSGNRSLSAVTLFYADVKALALDSTPGYVSQFARTELSTAVFYLANHAVAAYAVGAEDKPIWRQGLIKCLCRVNDGSADFPVLALGVATWALAQTGPLDDSLIDPSSEGAAYWQQKKLSDLPHILAGHQVGADGALPGGFYWRFDHSDGGSGGPVSGYTEDMVFASLGLVAAARADSGLKVEAAIRAARDALLSSLQGTDVVRQHLWLASGSRHMYAGEVLQALAELVHAADLDLDGQVDATDFSVWAEHWQESGCSGYCACGRGDLSRDGLVDYRDLMFIAEGWLVE